MNARDGTDAFVPPTAAELVRFAAGTLLVSASFWALSAAAGTFLISPDLPVSALMFIAPSVGLLSAIGPRRAWSELCAVPRQLRSDRSSLAWLPVMPLVVLATSPPSGPAGSGGTLPVVSLLALSAGFVISSLLEQLGWMWFAVQGLAPRWGVWPASMTTGAFWAGLHLIPWFQAGHSAGWVVGQSAFSVVFLCLIVQAYLPRHNLATAVALQSSYDAAWVWVGSVGRTYDPVATCLGTTALLIAAAATRLVPILPLRRPETDGGRWSGWLRRALGRPISAAGRRARQ